MEKGRGGDVLSGDRGGGGGDYWDALRQIQREIQDSHQAVIGEIADIKDTLGTEGDTKGAGARGLLGRFREIDEWRRKIERLLFIGIGIAASAGTAGTLIWWLIGERVALVLR